MPHSPPSKKTPATLPAAADWLASLPLRRRLADRRELVLQRLWRFVPGQVLVGPAIFGGRTVVAKLLVGQDNSQRRDRERLGLALLAQAGVGAPQALVDSALVGGGHAFLSALPDGAASLADACRQPFREVPIVAAAALGLLGRLHAAGLQLVEPQPDHFLVHGDAAWLVDGEALRVVDKSTQLSADLSLLLAQLPAEWDGCVADVLPAYAASGAPVPLLPALVERVFRLRAARVAAHLAASVRESTSFAVAQSAQRFCVVRREHAVALASLLRSPDQAIAAGCAFKDGGTTTVARVSFAQRELLIKRYNLKNLRHALGRLWRPSRAWHSWREGLRLQLLGIATPAPLALIEERLGPLRRRAWLICDYCPGANLLAHLSPDRAPPAAEADALQRLFATLHRLRISHGDLKATNLLWHAGRVQLIDLDAMVQHRSAVAHARAWHRDRARLLRNWPPDSALHHWLDAHLPAI